MAEAPVLIVEDDPTWQDIFRELVEDCGFRPVSVATLPEAVAALAGQAYALAIVDISLSAPDHADRGGVEVLKEIIQLPVRTPAIVVTGYATVDLAIETLVELEAVHFFRKDKFERREFAGILKKEAIKPGQVRPALLPGRKHLDLLEALTPREQEVLSLLIQGQTNKQIAKTLTITVNTAKKHVQSIFTKLDVDSRTAAVAKALHGDR